MSDDKLCPFCKKDNFCEVKIPNNDCWCKYVKFDKELLDLIPEKFKMKSCICKKCVDEFNKDKLLFVKKYQNSFD